MGQFNGKVALITGAGRGFGRATAECFAEAGASLVLNYRASRDGCEEVAAQARERGQAAITVQADVTDGPAVEAMVARAIAELGRIINISSQLALVGWDRAAVYAGTKGFILTWTKSLARELGQYNITVNAIGPGSIITDMNANVYPDEEAKRRRMAELPLRRFGSPRDVGECALFLASDAGSFLTGQMLGPNGGNVM